MPDKPIVETDPERMTRLDKIPMEQMSDEDRAFYIAHFERPDQQATLASEPEKSGDEQVTPAAQTEEIEIETSSEGEPEDETEDDDMARNNEKGGFAAQVKSFMNKHLFGGVTVGHLVALVIGALIILVASWAVTSSTDELEQQIADLTTENTRLQTGWNEANTTAPASGADCACEFNASTQEAAVAEATAEIQQQLDDCENETGGSAEVGTFSDEETKDWIDGKLSLKDTAVKTFVPFESTDEALEFVKEVYSYNSAHKLSWNNKEASYAVADAHKSDRDDVKMLFTAKNNDMFAVIPSESNYVIPQVYKFVEEDNEYALEEYDGADVAVVAMDKLKKSSSASD